MKNFVKIAVGSFLTFGVVASATAEPLGLRAQIKEAPVMPAGSAIALGGGVTGYAKSEAREYLGTGGYWEARAIFGTRSILGGEIAYVGSGREIVARGLDDRAMMVSNGIETNSRIGLPLRFGELHVKPFIMSGIGWQNLRVTRSETRGTVVRKSDNALTMPFGAGVGIGQGDWLLDFRFVYRTVRNQDLIQAPGQSRRDLQNWSLGVTCGYAI